MPHNFNKKIILYPHGGPHGNFTIGGNRIFSLLHHIGFVVCAVNYRGSSGYGQKSLESILGNIGKQDVNDCLACLDAAIAHVGSNNKIPADDLKVGP
eukprot:UN15632